MNERLARIRTRRALLQERAAHERDELGRQVRTTIAPVMTAAWALRALRLIRSKPALVGAAIVAVAVLRPGRALQWSVRAWELWQAWERIRGGRGRKA